MTKEQVIQKYKALGLETETGFDDPGKIYEFHKHEKTYLYSLKGSLDIRFGPWSGSYHRRKSDA